MSFQPVHLPQPLLIVPPLLPPLVLRNPQRLLRRQAVRARRVRPLPALQFRAYTDAAPDPYSIPLYEPSTEHERGLAAIFSQALELGRPVEVEYRDSVFFGPHRVPVSVRLA